MLMDDGKVEALKRAAGRFNFRKFAVSRLKYVGWVILFFHAVMVNGDRYDTTTFVFMAALVSAMAILYAAVDRRVVWSKWILASYFIAAFFLFVGYNGARYAGENLTAIRAASIAAPAYFIIKSILAAHHKR